MLTPGMGVLRDAVALAGGGGIWLQIWGTVLGLMVSHWACWGPSPPPCPIRLHPAPLEKKLVRPLPGRQLGLLPRRDAA